MQPKITQISKEIEDLSSTIHQVDLMDTYRTLHPTGARYTFPASAHRPLFRLKHMLGCKTSLHKFLKLEIIKSIFCNRSGVKLNQ